MSKCDSVAGETVTYAYGSLNRLASATTGATWGESCRGESYTYNSLDICCRFVLRLAIVGCCIASGVLGQQSDDPFDIVRFLERNAQPVAVIRPAESACRKISECIAMMPADSTATIDPDFAKDVEAAIAAHREPPA